MAEVHEGEGADGDDDSPGSGGVAVSALLSSSIDEEDSGTCESVSSGPRTFRSKAPVERSRG